MRSKLLFHLLTARPRTVEKTGFTMVAGILVILALVVGTLGVVAMVNGANLGALGSGEARDSQQVAEAGADQIIATFNQPENRQLLVAGSTPPNTWSTTNAALQSPCLSSKNTRPGTNGFPSSEAVSYTDGSFRNLEDITKTDAGTRRFVLKSIRYSTGTAGSADRRSIYVGYKADGTALTKGGTIPTGSTFHSLVNLDSGTATLAGTNSGFIAVEVEGRLYRADGTYSSSIITKEYEVMAKCCGGSFGSQGSGGSSTGLPFGKTGTKGALGADSRYCGLEWGMITGINNGRFLSQAAFRRYTRKDERGKIVPIGSILGIIANKGDTWDRKTTTKSTITIPAASGGFTYTGYIGCRTVPSPCNTTGDLIPGSSSNLASGYSVYNLATTPGPCPDIPTMNTVINLSPLTSALGDANSIAGRSASCIPILPLYLSSGLPTIADKYTNSWASGGNPETISKSTATTGSNIYPTLSALAGDSTAIWLRANRATGLDQKASSAAPYTPFVEYCNTKYLASNQCVSGSNNGIHTWAIISKPGDVIGGIGDHFDTYANLTEFTTIARHTADSTNRWPSPWTASATGNLQIGGGTVTFYLPGSGNTAAWGGSGTPANTTNTAAPAIARAVNLYALKNPVLEFQFSRNLGSGAGAGTTNSALRLDYSFTPPITTDSSVGSDTTSAGPPPIGWVQLATVTASGTVALSGTGANAARGQNCTVNTSVTPTVYTCRIGFPAAATDTTITGNRFSHYVKFRLRANSNFSNVATANAIKDVTLNSVAIKTDDGTTPSNAGVAGAVLPQYKNWCEFNASKPNTIFLPNGGFHCVGPTISISSTANDLLVDTTDGSISLYYNSSTDSRGKDPTTPVINLNAGGSLSNVQCPRANSTTTTPTDNCRTPVDEGVYAPVGEYDYLNIFGRDTPPGVDCTEMGLGNQPCNQNMVIGTDASSTTTDRARIAGAWFYLPWGLISFSSNGCGNLASFPILPDSFYYGTNDSWNFAGRLWVRSVIACGENHFRVPPSSSSSLNALVGEFNAANTGYIGWTGIDWVARSPTMTRKGFSLN